MFLHSVSNCSSHLCIVNNTLYNVFNVILYTSQVSLPYRRQIFLHRYVLPARTLTSLVFARECRSSWVTVVEFHTKGACWVKCTYARCNIGG